MVTQPDGHLDHAVDERAPVGAGEPDGVPGGRDLPGEQRADHGADVRPAPVDGRPAHPGAACDLGQLGSSDTELDDQFGGGVEDRVVGATLGAALGGKCGGRRGGAPGASLVRLVTT